MPAGTFTWGTNGSYVYVNKAVTLTGASRGTTTINISGAAGTYANGTIYVIAGGTVKSMTITQPGTNYTSAIIASTVNGWRITDITYNSAATVGYFIYGGTYGLIDHCTINGGGGTDEWIFTRGPSDAWQTASSMGTANAVYIEDCIFNLVGYTDFNANSRGVVRFCTITPTVGTIKLDAHGLATNSPPRSFRHIEFYNNTWSVTSNPTIEMRGGTGMLFNNAAAGGGAIYLGDYQIVYGTKTAADYPLDDQIGVGIDPKSAASEPVYLWNNTGTSGANNPASPNLYATSMAGVVNADRDYFDTNASFTGAGGVGTGTKASMLAINMTGKTLRVGYWVTDEASWRTGYAGISGQLYVWNGSAWVLKYTPYTYPHPLQGSSSNIVRTGFRLHTV